MLLDRHGRKLEDLRLSVTDRCNFRCVYCMPLDEYEWIPRERILSFEEIERLARLFVGFGVKKIRLTGGEPLVRRDLPDLVARLAPLDGLTDLAMTTNGARLEALAEPLRRAGLKRVTLSLDSLRPERFKGITKRGDLAQVLAGLRAAERAGLTPIKLNAVIERGVNDDEILDLVEFARERGHDIRFIEYMDVGNSNRWESRELVSKREILDIVGARYPLEDAPGAERGSAPAVDYRFADGRGSMGVIASVTEPFCGDCTRMRLTADGRLVTCLFSTRGLDLKPLLRGGADDDELRRTVRELWEKRSDRYSEQRWAALRSPTGYQPEARRKIEMISLGG